MSARRIIFCSGVACGRSRERGRLAICSERRANWKAALRDYEAALKRHPHRPLPLYGRGLVELHLGQRAAAQADFAAAAKADPDTAHRYAQIGLVP